MRSLVLVSLLARRSLPATLVIGVLPGERFAAHAWVELSGRPLLPAGDYERLVEL
jgi:Transglutaminase-like superfamily